MVVLGRIRGSGLGYHERRFLVTGPREPSVLEIRCRDSIDARTAKPPRLPWEKLEALADELVAKVPGVVSVTYGIAKKPPSTMEVV